MIFVHGDIHCDPHAGNIIIRKSKNGSDDVDVILLDHGLYVVSFVDIPQNYIHQLRLPTAFSLIIIMIIIGLVSILNDLFF